MKEAKVTLSAPVRVGGKEITEVMVRRSTVGDEEDALDMALRMGKGENRVSVEICLMSLLCGLPYDALRGMTGDDYAAIREGHNSLVRPTKSKTGAEDTQGAEMPIGKE